MTLEARGTSRAKVINLHETLAQREVDISRFTAQLDAMSQI